MALAQRLDLRTSQSLVMTPQLQQAIKLLQLSNLELAAVIDQELERNPLLERADAEGGVPMADRPDMPATRGDAPDHAAGDAPDRASDDTPADTPDDTPDDTPGDVPGDGPDWGTGGEPGPNDDGDFEDTTDDPGDWGMSLRSGFGDGGHDPATTARDGADLTSGESLREHVLRQVEVELPTLHERLIGAELCEWLDEAGYLRADLNEVAERLGVPPAQVERVLTRLQQFEPAGLFARDLAECLTLQLRERGQMDAVMVRLLDRLDLVAKRDFPRLARLCGTDGQTLGERVALLRQLDPKPAAKFGGEVAQPVTPDILMHPDSDGGWVIELNPDTLPRVLVNRRYYARIKAATRRSGPEREFIAERLASATWLVKALDQRATTIMKVTREIVRRQAGFFRVGIAGLKPLVLRDIAEEIGMHESTISRVTANKYLSCPRGVFELKFFFSGALGGADGAGSHAAESVRHRIKALIDAEAPEAILSDDQIVAALKAEGVDIARRTVAKYREGMHIPSSVQRRREKALRRGAA